MMKKIKSFDIPALLHVPVANKIAISIFPNVPVANKIAISIFPNER